MLMIGMIDYKVNTPSGASKIISKGNMILKQKKSALIDSIIRDIYNDDPLTSNKFRYDQLSTNDIVKNYKTRNEFIQF